jgi:4a-hydroxytetrahydrobiopterin dehydratase
MSNSLADRHCIPCSGGTPRLGYDEISRLRRDIPEWNVENNHHLERRYKFGDFKKALEFVNRVGAVAEDEGHHPDIRFGWGYADITIYTHAIDGLSESDFILAAKIDRL